VSLSSQLDTFLRKRPALGKDVYIARTGAVVLGDVTLGDAASVWYNAVLRGDINRIVVGHHSNIQDNAVLHLADELPCLVGDYVTIGHGAIVHACTVGDECLIGMGAVILDGAVGRAMPGRSQGFGDAAHENPRRLARPRRPRQGRARPDSWKNAPV
jgi:carbonic anhydrase/acetyltransferase-like protein (isoleucine patch superfamily)